MKKFYNVNHDYINSRLDKWFKRNVCDVPQSFIEKNIRKGKIKVNNKKIKSSYKLQKDDKVSTIDIAYVVKKNNSKLEKYIPTRKDLSFSSDMFIENNDNFAVINKPAGISVQSVLKVHEGRPNIEDLIRSGKIQLIINTPIGRQAIHDDKYLRRAALDYSVPTLTTLAGARAAVEAINALQNESISVVALQDIHKTIF